MTDAPNCPLDRPERRLKAARIAAGFQTAKEFADKNGLAPATFTAHERGKEQGGRGLNRKNADAYAKLFKKRLPDLTADWLLYGEGAAPAKVAAGQGAQKFGAERGAAGKTPARSAHDPGGGRIVLSAELFKDVVTATETYLSSEGISVPAERKGELFLALYQLAERDSEADGIDITRYGNVIRLAR